MKICEILGVEPYEKFCIKYTHSGIRFSKICYVNESGDVVSDESALPAEAICHIINNPEDIVKHDCNNGTHRAKDENGEWVYGYYYRIANEHFIIVVYNTNLVQKIKVKPDTVCRYVNLKDKNGKRIFTGDTASFRYYDGSQVFGEVCYSQWQNRFCVRLNNGESVGVSKYYMGDDIEVISKK